MGSPPAPTGAMLTVIASLAALLPAEGRAEWRVVDRGSPWSARRPVRPHTRYIVLHTTEGAERGALEKLAREGEAHYLVGRDGTVHRVVDKRKIATHAGRSMWEGRANLDEHALGVEVVGYHHERPNQAQIAALKELLRQLQSLYGIPDERVLTHSMVAYGAPNRWHRRSHRGRKRCAMRLADPAVRAAIGLRRRPTADPDVAAGRLVVADRDLFASLFPKGSPIKGSPSPAPTLSSQAQAILSAGLSRLEAAPRPTEALLVSASRSPWDIAREAYDSPDVRYTFPDGRTFRGNEISDWHRIPAGTRVEMGAPSDLPDPSASSAGEASGSEARGFDGFAIIGVHGDDPRTIAGDEHAGETTIYLFPDGLVRTGAQLSRSGRYRFLLERAPKGTRVLVGYRYGGYVTARRPPSVICGARWNYPSTFYRFPDGKIRSGDEVEAAKIPKSTLVFFQS